jgi:hypothetical protein
MRNDRIYECSEVGMTKEAVLASLEYRNTAVDETKVLCETGMFGDFQPLLATI